MRPRDNEEEIVEKQTKEHGMLFKGEMVVANIEGRKTQTRRPITFHNSKTAPHVPRKEWHKLRWDEAWLDEKGPSPAGNPGPYWHVPFEDIVVRVYPRIQPGDIIWVKETWTSACGTGCSNCNWSGDEKDCSEYQEKIFFRASDPDFSDKWKSSLLLKRTNSRTDLKVQKMRSERVQEISEEDAWAEGCPKGEPTDNGGYFPAEKKIDETTTLGWCFAKEWFGDLWDSINEERGFPWEKNHPVWVHEYKGKP
jgi:hypothetical protein